MTRFLLRRLAGSAIVLLGLSVITFALARVVPSNPAAVYIGPKARPEDIERVARELGLDQPLPIQYLTYMRDMLTGDWGISIGTKRPVLDEIVVRLPATLELIFAAMLLAIPIGIAAGRALGTLAAPAAGPRGPGLISIVGVSLPAFWLGLLLQVLFFRTLHLLPAHGTGGPGPAVHRAHRRLHRIPPDRHARHAATGSRSGTSCGTSCCRR